MLLKTLARVTALALPASALALGVAAPAHAGSGDAAEAQSCGSASYCVQVSYSGTAAPAGGGGGTAVTSVPPTCWYEPWKTTKAAESFVADEYNQSHYSGIEYIAGWGGTEQYNDAAKNKPDASWYILKCSVENFYNDPRVAEYAGTALEFPTGGFVPNYTLLVEPGQAPPPPVVDVEVLRDAAYDSIDIPDPQIQRNPDASVGGATGATLVNVDTMFWADGYQDAYWIEARVGNVWARVTADAEDFVLSSPAGGQTCTHEQFTTAYTSGDAPAGACAFPFMRASIGYGSGFPVTTTATWGASWTSSETPGAQPLPPVTTDSSVDVPVAESQALVKTVG